MHWQMLRSDAVSSCCFLRKSTLESRPNRFRSLTVLPTASPPSSASTGPIAWRSTSRWTSPSGAKWRTGSTSSPSASPTMPSSAGFLRSGPRASFWARNPRRTKLGSSGRVTRRSALRPWATSPSLSRLQLSVSRDHHCGRLSSLKSLRRC
jgi:hypothetical protein